MKSFSPAVCSMVCEPCDLVAFIMLETISSTTIASWWEPLQKSSFYRHSLLESFPRFLSAFGINLPFLFLQLLRVSFQGISKIWLNHRCIVSLRLISFFRIYLTICASYEPFIVLFSIIFLHLEEKAFLLTYQRSAGPILKVSPIHCLESHAVEDDLCCDR